MIIQSNPIRLAVKQRHDTYVEDITPHSNPSGKPVQHSRLFSIEATEAQLGKATVKIVTGPIYFSVRQQLQGVKGVSIEVPFSQIARDSSRVFKTDVSEGDTLIVHKSGEGRPDVNLIEEDVLTYVVGNITPDEVNLEVKAKEFTPD